MRKAESHSEELRCGSAEWVGGTDGQKKASLLGRFSVFGCQSLEHVPEVLVVDVVVELYFGTLDNRPKQARAPIS